MKKVSRPLRPSGPVQIDSIRYSIKRIRAFIKAVQLEPEDRQRQMLTGYKLEDWFELAKRQADQLDPSCF